MRFTKLRALMSLLGLAALIWTACNGAPAPTLIGVRTGTEGVGTATQLGAQRITLQDNSTAKLSDYAGKVVVLDFWATYCPPCVAATPDFETLHKQYAAQGLQILGINVGGPDDRAEVPKFLTAHNLTYPIAYPADDYLGAYYMGQDDRIPQTLVYDRQGKLLKHVVGYNDKIKQELAATIQNALAAK